MTKVEKIEKAVLSLPKPEYDEFRRWFLERDWEEWDQEIEADSKNGNLDFLLQEAAEAKRSGQLLKL